MQADRTLLVMEYMIGGDLLNQIKHDSRGHFRWHKRGWSIALDIARGLNYLHSHNVGFLVVAAPDFCVNLCGNICMGTLAKSDSCGFCRHQRLLWCVSLSMDERLDPALAPNIGGCWCSWGGWDGG